MSHILLREKAIKLRLQGETYGQIRKALNISKSTLSDWLRKIPLTEEQVISLSRNKEKSRELAREKYITTRRIQKLDRLKRIYHKQCKELLPLTKRELFLAGVFLYWGEGEKKHGRMCISNTDPKMVIFALYWMVNCLGVPKERIKINLHLYKDMKIEESIIFWSTLLDVPKNQFRKPYIKKTNREGLTYKSFGHGTCRLYVGSVDLSEKVAMTIKSISDKYGAKDEVFWYN